MEVRKMIENQVIETLMNRKSIRKYKDLQPSEEEVDTVVMAGQQAPFAMQMGSVVLSRDSGRNVFGAPLQFLICADVHRMELVMDRRGWKRISSDIYTLIFALQDAAYMAQNMVIAGESLGMGSCYVGSPPFMAARLRKDYDLPCGVYPLVILTMGYPDEDPPTRPRYPLEFHLFRDRYPELDASAVKDAMEVMDRGYLEQDYYTKAGYMIPLPEEMEEKFDFSSYSWTEHISRKLGLWGEDPREVLQGLESCGFHICDEDPVSGKVQH
jgi:nitroreductase